MFRKNNYLCTLLVSNKGLYLCSLTARQQGDSLKSEAMCN